MPLLDLVPESYSYMNWGRVAREFARGASLEPPASHARWVTKVKHEMRGRLYLAPELVGRLGLAEDDHVRVLERPRHVRPARRLAIAPEDRQRQVHVFGDRWRLRCCSGGGAPTAGGCVRSVRCRNSSTVSP